MDEPLAPVARDTCRICAAPLLPILSLGSLHLPDFPASAGTIAHPPVPLDLVRCERLACGLVQLRHTTPREWLYRAYWYRSGVNESMVAELRDVVVGAFRYVERDRDDLTVGDIGANDGTLLRLVPEVLRHPRGLTRIAWEPARNLYQPCRPHCEVLFPDFFEAPGEPWRTKVDALFSVACFYDLDDPQQFVADVAKILAPSGVWVIQQAYVLSMVVTNGFDNVGHEHLEYYALGPLEYLLAQHGLEVFRVELRAINGGSFRTYVQWKGVRPVDGSVPAMRLDERRWAMADPWPPFVQRVQAVREQLSTLLGRYEATGTTVDLLGASTKGGTLVQYCGLDARSIRQAWERSPEKVGRYYGVSGIPIVSEEAGRADPPDVLLTTIWQFREGLLQREAEFLGKGGRIVFPLPRVEVVHRV